MIPNIVIYQRPAEGGTFRRNITDEVVLWRQTSRAIGGFWEATFDIDPNNPNIINYFNNWLGKEVKANTYGLPAWEGIITQIDLIQDGFNYRSTLDVEWWHNSMRVVFRSTISDPWFIGSGLDDFEVGGSYSLEQDLTYTVEIDATGTPDTFRWKSEEEEGEGEWEASGVEITGDWQELENGIFIKFSATTGHTLGDTWVFTATQEPVQAHTPWRSNLDSIEKFGKREYVHTLGQVPWGAARALRDVHLKEFAWPRGMMAGSYLRDPTAEVENVLRVQARGFWDTLNWEYYEGSQVDTNIETVLHYFISESQYLSIRSMERNETLYELGAHNIAQRYGDIIEDAVATGDGLATLFQGGVYEDRGFVYKKVPTTVDYILDDDTVLNRAGNPVVASLLRPGFLVRNPRAPSGPQPPGESNVWDAPDIGYVDQVTYETPDKIELGFYGAKQSVVLLEKRLAGQ